MLKWILGLGAVGGAAYVLTRNRKVPGVFYRYTDEDGNVRALFPTYELALARFLSECKAHGKTEQWCRDYLARKQVIQVVKQ